MTEARLLYLPNEGVEGDQFGFRAAVNDAVRVGLLAAAEVFSPLARLRAGVAQETMRGDLHRHAAVFKPTIILVQHPAGTGLRSTDFARLKQAGDQALLAYHEDDPYSRIRQPLPPEARAAARACDVAYTCGTGRFPAVLRRFGSGDVRYSRHCFDETRFPVDVGPAAGVPRWDCVMIANRNHSLRPWRVLPGARQRIDLVDRLTARFGSRFAVFGSGWISPSAAGPVGYDQQHAILKQARVSVNWDHFPTEPMYYSDRLPISLAAGVPHVTTWHEGYADLFGAPARSGLFWAPSVKRLVSVVEDLVQRPAVELEMLGKAAATFASAHLSQSAEYRRLLSELVGLRHDAAEHHA
jgi:hypothetical protein